MCIFFFNSGKDEISLTILFFLFQMGMNPVDTMRNMDPNSLQAKLEWERIQKQHFNELNGNNR